MLALLIDAKNNESYGSLKHLCRPEIKTEKNGLQECWECFWRQDVYSMYLLTTRDTIMSDVISSALSEQKEAYKSNKIGKNYHH